MWSLSQQSLEWGNFEKIPPQQMRKHEDVRAAAKKLQDLIDGGPGILEAKTKHKLQVDELSKESGLNFST